MAYSLARGKAARQSLGGEWRGSGVLSGARTREKATAVTCTWAALGQRENTGTDAKQKQLPTT